MMGVSLGGYFAPRAAAFEPRVKAAIANAGAYNFSAHFEQRPLLTREAFVYRLKVPDQAAPRTMLQAFDLQGVMEKVKFPLLVILGPLDTIVSPGPPDQILPTAPGPDTPPL